MDVTNHEHVKKAVSRAIDDFSSVNILICNADKGAPDMKILKYQLTEWQNLIFSGNE